MNGNKFLSLLCVLMTGGCASSQMGQIGMTERHWLWTTLVGDLASDDGTERVWRSGGAYYHFREGKLVKIDQGVQQIEVRAAR